MHEQYQQTIAEMNRIARKIVEAVAAGRFAEVAQLERQRRRVACASTDSRRELDICRPTQAELDSLDPGIPNY